MKITSEYCMLINLWGMKICEKTNKLEMCRVLLQKLHTHTAPKIAFLLWTKGNSSCSRWMIHIILELWQDIGKFSN